MSPLDHYVGSHELKLSKGSFAFPEVQIERWRERNGKNSQVTFYGKLEHVIDAEKYKYIALYDPKIYSLGVDSGGLNLMDFLDFNFITDKRIINPQTAIAKLLAAQEIIKRKKLSVPENRIVSIQDNIRDLVNLKDKVILVGSDNYLELWNFEARKDFEALASLSYDLAKNPIVI